MKKKMFLLSAIALLIFSVANSQKIVSVTDTMSVFTLPSVSGSEVSLSDFKGKNVMLIFPRGRVNDSWCHICHYQYVELADLELKEKIQEKYNLQIIFILPYDRETVDKWVKMMPKQMSDIEGWKHPANPEILTKGEQNWMNMVINIFPNSYVIDSTYIPTPFPILIDADRQLSKSLGIFTTFWDNSYVEQNIASIFLVDKNGILQFKYISQNTFDRPDNEYLFRFIDKMMNN
jgi:peroxiredoxin